MIACAEAPFSGQVLCQSRRFRAISGQWRRAATGWSGAGGGGSRSRSTISWEGDTGQVKPSRVAAVGGLAGPVLFTVAWVVSSLRQPGHSAADVQLSGLAAADARDPQTMIAGLVMLGAGTMLFGTALRPVTPRPAGPWLVVAAGAASVAAGVFRRDTYAAGRPGVRRWILA